MLGCAADDVGLTRATTDGVNVDLGGLRFAPGDERLNGRARAARAPRPGA
jgi:hypothetical protein